MLQVFHHGDTEAQRASGIRREVLIVFVLTVLLLTAVGFAQQPAAAGATQDKFAALAFLTGTWTATPDADSAQRLGLTAGKPSGAFTFLPELGGNVLVRRNVRSAADNPAYTHDDVLYVYPEGGVLRAIYFDSEGHVIHYVISTAPGSAVFLSETPEVGPRFRLSYHLTGEVLDGRFELAMPGAEFQTYLHWTSVKAKQ